MILSITIPNFYRVLLFCLLTASSVAAQYRFDHWTTEHGLPQNSVLSITQTRDGYLWLATYNGLVRFDGVRFTVFDKNNTKALKTSRYWDLFEDVAGALWGTSLEGVIRYHNGVFAAYTNAEGLPDNSLMLGHVQCDVNGVPLITTEKGAVWWRAGRFASYEFNADRTAAQIHLGRSGTHWSLDKNGLHARGNGLAQDYRLPFEPKEIFKGKLHEDRHGALWVAVAGHGVLKVKDGVISDYTARLKLKSSDLITRILEDRDGSLWFGAENSGLRRFRDAPGEVAALYDTSNGLVSNAVRGLWQDSEGTLWIGLDGGGLSRMTRQVISTFTEAQGLTGNVVHAVLEDRAGNIWATTQAGLGKISGGKVTVYLPGNAPRSLPLSGLQALYEDRSGRLWIGSSTGFCSFKDGVFSQPTRDVSVWAFHEDRQGAFWIGTHTGLLKLKDGAQTGYTMRDGLPSNVVKAIYEDRQGALWFGVLGGLVKYQNERFTVFSAQYGLENDRIWSIHEDPKGMDGALWLGTFDSGLLRFRDGRFTRYTMAQGLYDNGAFQVLEDDAGYLWMSSYRGLHRVSRQQLNDYADGKIAAVNSTVYGKAEGMLVADCNGGRQPSGVKTRDGRLWFTTIKGLAVVNPNQITANPLPPPVLIEGAMLDREPTDITAGLRVLPGQSNLEINYTALSFIKADQVRFKYQLVNQDPAWIEAGTKRSANYSYLRPGQYTFKVMAANSDGVWSNEDARLLITVLPAFYQTWWFRLLAALSVVGGIGLIFKRRLDQANQARRAQKEYSRRLIDSQEAERKRIAAELHDSLGQDLLVIKNWIAYGLATFETGNPARETLEEISTATAQAVESCREIAYNLRPHHVDYIGLTEALRAMLNKIGQSSGLRIEAQLDDLTGALPKDAEINLFRIVQESLNNIVKHARATEVTVIIRRNFNHDNGNPPRVVVEIRDNGRGFDPATPPRRGLGLSGITERAQMLGGTAVIDAAPGRGTLVSVSLPIRSTKESFPQ